MKQPTRIVLGTKSSPFKSIRDKIVRSLSFKEKTPKQVNVVPRKSEKEKSSSTRQVVHTSNADSLPINGPLQDGIDSFRVADTYFVTNVLPPRIDPPPIDAIDSFQSAGTYAIEERARDLEERASTFEHQSRMMSNIKGQGTPYNMSSIRECLMHNSESSDDVSMISELELIKRCVEEKRDLALELAAEIRARAAERVSSDEALRNVKAEMEFKLKLLEKENEAKVRETVEEMESEWSMKLEVAMSKGMKTRERLNRIAQEKVELHKEISLLVSKKNALVERVHECEETIEALRMSKVGSMGSSSCQEKEELAWSGLALTKEYREKEEEEEEKGLLQFVKKQSELEKVCNEKVKTLQGLRRLVLGEETKCREFGSFSEDLMSMIRMEMVRLSGIEQALRQEVETHKKETLVVDPMEHSGIMAETLDGMTRNESMVGSKYHDSLDHLEYHIKMVSLSIEFSTTTLAL